jgi:tetratricopeptide (TPR) repeat protein
LRPAYLQLPTGDRAENLGKAIACYQEALAVEYLPSQSRARYLRNLGDAYSEQQNHVTAIEAYRQAVDATPDDPWLFNAIGNAHSRQKQHEQAVEAYTAALDHAANDEDRALLLRNRAGDLIHLDRLDEAEQDCEQASAPAPDHHYTFARWGQLAFARGDYTTAVERYTAALDRQEEGDFHFDRGLAHLTLGRPDQAVADYDAALPLANAITTAEALEELEEFATEHPDTPGLDAVRALFSSAS